MNSRTLPTCFLFLILVLASGAAYGQSFNRGDVLVNAGIGLNSFYSGGVPLGGSLEVGVSDNVGLGVAADVVSSQVAGTRYTALYVGGRGALHLGELLDVQNDRVDIYTGLTLGYRLFFWNTTQTSTITDNRFGRGIYYNGFFGGRLFLTHGLGGFAEFGLGGATNIRLGVTFKL